MELTKQPPQRVTEEVRKHIKCWEGPGDSLVRAVRSPQARAALPGSPLAGELSLSTLICKWDHLPHLTLQGSQQHTGRLGQSQDARP